MNKQIIRLTESDLHRIVKESVNKILKEMDEGTEAQNDFIRGLCARKGIQYDPKYNSLSTRDASGLITLLKKLRVKKGEQPPTIEQLMQQMNAAPKQPTSLSFMDYDEVTPELVNRFWSQDRYAQGLININKVRPDFQPAYEKAKKNVAMLEYAMSPSYTVYFDREGNLYIHVNTGASWSLQNHLHHYAGKCAKHFKLWSAASGWIDRDRLELLYDREKVPEINNEI